MNRKIKYNYSLIIVGLFLSVFFACKKTPDRPPVKLTTAGGTYTIQQIRALYNGQNIKFTQDISLYATVTMTDNYKTLYLRDQTGAISLKQLTAHGIFAGDSLRVNLNGSTLDLSGTAGSLQIDSVDVSNSPTNKVVKLAVGKYVAPLVVSIAQLNQSVSNTTYNSPTGNFFVPNSQYDAQMVIINDAQFSFVDTGNFIPPNTGALFFNHSLFDCGGLNSINISLYGGTADFLNQRVPNNKSGSIIAAVSFYNDKLQLTPRSFADLNFNQPRCGMQTLTQTFDTVAFGTGATLSSALFPGWVTQRQVGYSQFWQGASSGPVNFPSVSLQYSTDSRNVVWLISPPIQNSPTKNLSFQSFTSYNTVGKNLLSVLISTDYNGYNLGGVSGVQIGSQAHWTDITNAFVFTTSGSSNVWSFLPSGKAYLNTTNASTLIPANYTGTFYIGFRYTGVKSIADSSASYGINNVMINN